MIEPTVGRIVWIRNRPGSIDPKQPEGGFVTYVHSPQFINVAGFDANGKPFAMTLVYLCQESSAPASAYAEWMPYQKGQAAKTEELERAAHHPV